MNYKAIRIKEDVFNDISEYCKLNGIKISDFCSEKLKEAVLIEKYGDTPFGTVTTMPKKVEMDAKTIGNYEQQEAEISTNFAVEIERPNITEIDLTKKVEEIPTVRKRRL